jgi:hypothetical protein
MTKTLTQPQFKLGSRVFSHYVMGWGTVVEIGETRRGDTHGVTGSKLPDTTWYDVWMDKGSRELLDDAHGNWDMARVMPEHIAKRFGYGEDPTTAMREAWTIMAFGVDLRSHLVLSLVKALGYGNNVGGAASEDPAGFADNVLVAMGKRTAYNEEGDYTNGYEEYAKVAGLIRQR